MRRYENVIIRASAGTGKTFQLSNRFIALLNAGAPVDQILATTFTRKAAGEILERVLERLALAALNEDACQKLTQQLNDPLLSRARCLALLQQLVEQLHRLRISTLDSFFAQVATSFCLELGLPPGWRIVEELDDARLRTEAMEEVLGSDESEEVSRLMHLLTKGAAERSVTDLLRWTVDRLYGVFQETDAEAWQRIPEGRFLSSERLQAAIEQLARASIPDDKRIEKAVQASVAAAREGEWEVFLEKGYPPRILAGENTFYSKSIPADVAAACQQLLNHARAFFLEQLRHQTLATYQLLAKFDAVYQRRKRLSRGMRFEDITRMLSRAAGYGSLQRLDFRLDAQLSHVLLDEFQDTSLAQWQVLRPFAERVVDARGQQSFFWEGGQTSFFCVGDLKQAIYGWRGGRSELFDALERQLPGLERLSLTHSYRSSPPVIEAVNQIFAGIQRHPKLETAEAAVRNWCAQYETHSTACTDLQGYVVLETAPAAGEDEDAEQILAAAAARKVADLTRQAPDKTIGVLTRRNITVARVIFELKQLNIEASEEGGNPLTDSAAVLAVLALLQLSEHPGDEVARFHVAQSPLASIWRFQNWKDAEAADRLARDIRALLLNEGYGEALRQLTAPLRQLGSRRDATRLQQLVQLAYQFQAHSSLRPRDFVRFVETQRVADPISSPVRVMTIHQAKGLQFDIVVLTELDEGITGQPPPFVVHQSAPDQPIDRVCMYRNKNIQAVLPEELQQMFENSLHQEVAESLCVLYVALTRAVHALHLLIAAPKKNESNLPRTMAGLVRAALTDGGPIPPETIAFELGERHWWRREQEKLAVRPAAEAPDVSVSPRVARATPLIQFADEKTRPALQRTAPSSLEDGGRVAVRHLLRLDNLAGRARGSIIHAWLEQIEWIETGVPDADQLRRIALQLAGPETDIEAELQWFFELLQTPVIQSVLRRDTYWKYCQTKFADRARSFSPSLVQIHRERRFAVQSPENQRLLSGIIDRLALIRDRDRVVAAEIIDFKTDYVVPNNLEQIEAIAERYRPQQEAYQQAIRQLYDLEPQHVTARLVLLRASQIHELVAQGGAGIHDGP